tara:strand:+ start:1262 stop:3010 length:1749 start_codon:yes stop_codon:yes gene_type:complete
MIQKKLYKKKILIIGSGSEQISAIKEAKKMGIFVISTDKDNKAPGKKFSNKFYNLDTKDVKGNLKIAKKNKVNGVMTLCSETSVPTVNLIAKTLKLPFHKTSTVINSTNKYFMKKNFLKYKIPTSNFFLVHSFFELKKKIKKIKYPCVIKPLNLYGQKNVYKLSNSVDIKKRYFACSKSGKKPIILEKFIEGQEINVVALIKNKKIKILSLSDRNTFRYGKSFGIAYEHCYPSSASKNNLSKIKVITKKFVKALNISEAVIYPQFIVTNNSKIYTVEVAIRIPGGNMRELSMLASGIDPVRFEIARTLGLKKSFLYSKIYKKNKSILIYFFTKHNFKSSSQISPKKISKIKKSKEVFSIYLPKLKKIPNLETSASRFGYIILASNKRKNLKTKLVNFLKLLSNYKSNKFEFENTFNKKAIPILNTKRLKLVPISDKNFNNFHFLRKIVYRENKNYFEEEEMFSLKQHLKWYEDYKSANRVDSLIFHKKDKKFIGAIHYKIKSNELQMGKFISYKKYRSKKYGFEATKKWLEYAKNYFNSKNVFVITSKNNIPNIKLNKKLGFQVDKKKSGKKLWIKMIYQLV